MDLLLSASVRFILQVCGCVSPRCPLGRKEQKMAEPSPPEQARSERFWVRLCRWLWRGFGFFWITVVLGLGVNIISTRLTSQTDFPADTPVGWVLGHLLLTSSLGAGLLLLT